MTPFHEQPEFTLHIGDASEVCRTLPAESVNCIVTSPPYWGLRDYGVAGQLGLEETPEEYIARLVSIFEDAKQVLRSDGTLWLNLGDSYAGGGCGARDPVRWPKQSRNDHMPVHAKLKTKDLVGVPWMAAFALRAAGWYLRADIIWHKPNPMPESVTDRPTKAHEYLFLLSKSERYAYNADAIRSPLSPKTRTTFGGGRKSKGTDALGKVASDNWAKTVPLRKPRLNADGSEAGANRRSVWTVATQPFEGAHFATFPPDLVDPCILAGSPPGGVVLDPFSGAGTTGVVATKHGRRYVGIELKPAYAEMARDRLLDATAQRSLFAAGST